MAQKKILVADDSRTIRKAIEITFAKTDFVLHFAQSGQSAWEKIKSISPDITILDHRMDPPNGYDLCERIKADPSTKHIQTVLLYSPKYPLNEEKGGLADARLVKPFETQALLDLADRLAQVEVAPAVAPAVAAKPAAQEAADDIPMGLTLDDEEEFDEIEIEFDEPEIEIDEPKIEIDEPEVETPAKPAAPVFAPATARPAPPPAARVEVKPAAPPSAPTVVKPTAPPSAPLTARPSTPPSTPAASKPSAPLTARPSTPPSTPAAAKPTAPRPEPVIAKPTAPRPEPVTAKPAAPRPEPVTAKPAAPPSAPAAKTPPWVPSKPKTAPWVPSTAKPAAPPSAPVVKPAAEPEAEPTAPDRLKETTAPTTAPQAPKLSMKPMSSLAAAIKGDKKSEVTSAGAKVEAIEQVSGKSTPDKAAVSTEPRQAAEAGPASLTTRAVEATLESIKKKGPEYEAIADLSMEMIERIVWEVVPELAEVIIKENLNKLTRNKTGF